MDDTCDQFHAGRRLMVEAFVDLSTLAMRAGADYDEITALHGRFFDGHVQIRRSFRVAVILARLRISR